MSKYDKEILVIPSGNSVGFPGGYYSGIIQDEPGWYAELNSVGVALDRAAAETNPEYLQIIPYVVVGTLNEDNSIQYILGAERLSGGNEDRLHGAITLGFGGHVEWVEGSSPREMLWESVSRELEEELGLASAEYPLYLWGHLVNTLDEVGRVHLGVVFFLDVSVNRHDVLNGEPHKLSMFWTEPVFLPHLEERLEAWAKLTMSLLPTLPRILQ